MKRGILIGDIHLDNSHDRHNEQMYVMDKLYESLQRDVDEKTAIFITGDIYHNKGRKETMCEQLWHTFLGRVNKLCPVLVIPGNHDLSPKHDKTYPDAVEASLAGGCYENVHYLGRTGMYKMGNMEISTVSIKDLFQDKAGSGGVTTLPEVPNWYTNDVEYKMMMMHSTVYEGSIESYDGNKSKIPLGWIPREVEYLMLGDLHIPMTHAGQVTSQTMNTKFRKNGLTWGYPGSLMQNTFGETVSMHGYQVWDFEKKMITQVPIEQHTIRMTARLENGDWKVNNMTPEGIMKELGFVPKKVLLRTIANHKYDEMRELKERLGCEVNEVSCLKEIIREGMQENRIQQTLSDVQSLTFEDTIVECMKTQEGHKEEYEEMVRDPAKVLIQIPDMEGHATLEELIKSRKKTIMNKYEKLMSIRSRVNLKGYLKIRKIRCHMILCYKDMYMDFDDFVGKVVAMMGKNGDGKTAIVEIIIYVIFGIFLKSRTIKNGGKSHDIRSFVSNKCKKTDKPFIEAEFELNETIYKIRRAWSYNNTSWESEKRELYYVMNVSTGAYEAIGAETQKWIEANIGGEEVVMNLLQSQGGDMDIFNLSEKDQNVLISKILRLDEYEHLWTAMDEMRKALEAIGRTLNTSKSVVKQNMSEYDRTVYEAKMEQWRKLDDEIRVLENEMSQTSQEWHDIDMSEEVKDEYECEKEWKTMEKPLWQKEELMEKRGECKGWLETSDEEAFIKEKYEEAATEYAEKSRELQTYQQRILEKTKDLSEIYYDKELKEEDLKNERVKEMYEETRAKVRTSQTRDEVVMSYSNLEMENRRFDGLESIDPDIEIETETEIEPEQPSRMYKWDGNKKVTCITLEDIKTEEVDLERMKEIKSEKETKYMKMDVVAKPRISREEVNAKNERWKEVNKYVSRRLTSYEKTKKEMEEMQSVESELLMYKRELEKMEETLKDCPYNDKCEACRKQPIRIQKERIEESIKEGRKKLKKKSMTEEKWRECQQWRTEYESVRGVEDELKEWEYYEEWNQGYTKIKKDVNQWRETVHKKECDIRKYREEYERSVYLRWVVWATRRRTYLLGEIERKKEELKWMKESEYLQRVINTQPIYNKRESIRRELRIFEENYESTKKGVEKAKRDMEEYDSKWKYKRYKAIEEKIEYLNKYAALEREVNQVRRRRELKPVYDNYNRMKEEGRVLYEKKEKLSKEIGGKEYEKTRYEKDHQRMDEYETYSNTIATIENDVKEVITRIKGYRTWLLREKVGPMITAYTNAISRQLHGSDEWVLNHEVNESGDIQWYMLNGGEVVYMHKSSGFQRFMMMMAMRVALSQISNTVKCKQLIIDEGFVSADEEHLERVPEFLKGLVGIYESVILVSHLDVIKDSVDKYIEVKREDNVSYLDEEKWMKELENGDDIKKKRQRRGKEKEESVEEEVPKLRGRLRK